jgi:hypothetical protein
MNHWKVALAGFVTMLLSVGFPDFGVVPPSLLVVGRSHGSELVFLVGLTVVVLEAIHLLLVSIEKIRTVSSPEIEDLDG